MNVEPGSQFPVLSSWFSVPGSQFLVLSSWFLVLGSRFLVLGSWFLVLGSWFLVLGSRFLAGRVGFEPTWAFRPNSFSRRARSTAPSPPHLKVYIKGGCRWRAAPVVLATLGRFERPTSSSAGKRSNPLSYRVRLCTPLLYHESFPCATRDRGEGAVMMGQQPQRRIGRAALCHRSRPTGGVRADVNAHAERTKPR